MYIDNIANYIISGLGIPPEPKQFKLLISGPAIWSLFCFVPGSVLGGYWLLLSILMLLSSFIAMILVFRLSSKELTIKRRLILQLIIYSSYVLQFSLSEMLIFTMKYGFNIFLLLLYIPLILIPVLLGFRNSKRLRKSVIFDLKQAAHSRVRITAMITGIIGMNIASFLKDVDQNTVVIILLTGCSLLNGIFSVGFLSIQRLYYLSLCRKRGVILETT